MEICVIGAGYVGLTTAAVLADLGHVVCCVDTNVEKIHALKLGKVPIYEPGLSELIKKNEHALTFSTSTIENIKKSQVIFIAVGTPSLPDGRTDLFYLHSVIDEIAETIESYKTIIIKSTVPIGTNDDVYKTIIQKGVDPLLFNVVSNPEFLKEGSAIYDMVHPDKIVVGKLADDQVSLFVLKEIYQKIDAPFIVTSLAGAEMIKYASNAFLATKISFINEIARICDRYSINVADVAKGIGTDPRISPYFLSAGIGYGGSCFPKDLRSLEHSALDKNVTPLILQAVQAVNRSQVDYYIDKLSTFMDDFSEKNISVLGISFKPNTDDTRYSPAVALIERLSSLGGQIKVYDPQAQFPFPENHHVIQYTQLDLSIIQADCVIIATDWEEFKHLDWRKIKEGMRGKYIFDARNFLDPNLVREAGLIYMGVARL